MTAPGRAGAGARRSQSRRAPFEVVPAELGDDHVLQRIPHRALVKRWAIAWLTEDGEPLGDRVDGKAIDRATSCR